MSFHCIVWYCMVLYCIRVFCTVSHCHVPLLQRAGELPRSASSHFDLVHFQSVVHLKPNGSISLWMCTKSQKDGQTHKNTGVRRAIFLKRSARRATWVHCKPNLAVSDSGRIKVLNWGLSPHGDQTNLDYTAEAKNLWCSKFTDTHCDVIQIHTVMWCADQTIPKYAAPTWWSPFDTVKKIYQ